MSLKRLAVACLLAASLMAVGSAPAEPKEDCSGGASSVIVEHVNGQYVESGPVTTGCIPTAP
ncbi:MAG: hypothetical protein ACRDNH_06245 [Gaiellaceae bacterium]